MAGGFGGGPAREQRAVLAKQLPGGELRAGTVGAPLGEQPGPARRGGSARPSEPSLATAENDKEMSSGFLYRGLECQLSAPRVRSREQKHQPFHKSQSLLFQGILIPSVFRYKYLSGSADLCSLDRWVIVSSNPSPEIPSVVSFLQLQSV